MRFNQLLVIKVFFVTALLICSVIQLEAESPELMWAKRAGGTGDCRGTNVVADNEGNIYVSGLFQGTATFGDIELHSVNVPDNANTGEMHYFPEHDKFIAKMNSKGEWLWAKRFGGRQFRRLFYTAVDNDSNVYIAGDFSYRADFAGTVLKGKVAQSNIFVAKLDSQGNLLWLEQAGGNHVSGITLDRDGALHLVGIFVRTAAFGEVELQAMSTSIYVAKIDSHGNWLQAVKGGVVAGVVSQYKVDVADIAVDIEGNRYVAGEFKNNSVFGTIELQSVSVQDIFLAKLDTEGNWLWARRAGGTHPTFNSKIVVDINEKIYLYGRFTGTAAFGETVLQGSEISRFFIAKLDTEGNWLWARQAGPKNSWHQVFSIAVDDEGSTYITGQLRGSFEVGETLLNSNSQFLFFTAKVDDEGNWLWAETAEGLLSGRSIAVDSDRNVYVTGGFMNVKFGAIELQSKGSNDIFVVKYKQHP